MPAIANANSGMWLLLLDVGMHSFEVSGLTFGSGATRCKCGTRITTLCSSSSSPELSRTSWTRSATPVMSSSK
eukprot:512941-Rhodomonas_salina.1